MADIAYEAKYSSSIMYEAYYIREWEYCANYIEVLHYNAHYQSSLLYPAEYDNLLRYDGDYGSQMVEKTHVEVTPLQNEGTPIADIDVDGVVSHLFSGPGGSGTNDYEQLVHKPQIESVPLIGNKMLPDIGVDTMSILDIAHIFD